MKGREKKKCVCAWTEKDKDRDKEWENKEDGRKERGEKVKEHLIKNSDCNQ